MLKRILISRTDNLGDVILTLPLAGYLKTVFPSVEITFMAKSYTAPIVKLSTFVDHIMLWDELENLPPEDVVKAIQGKKFDAVVHVYPNKKLAKLCRDAQIPIRVGTSNRFFHWRYCNRLSFFSRKRSNFHETELNIKLLIPLLNPGVTLPKLKEMISYVGISALATEAPSAKISSYLRKDKFNLILHPKSYNSAMEWPLSYYRELAESLDPSKYHIIVTGTQKELVMMEMELLNPLRDRLVSTVGKLSLSELARLMKESDGIVAASTGPLHLAAILSLHTLGLFPAKRPMFPTRWLPIGRRVSFFLSKKNALMDDISPEKVKLKILSWDKLQN